MTSPRINVGFLVFLPPIFIMNLHKEKCIIKPLRNYNT